MPHRPVAVPAAKNLTSYFFFWIILGWVLSGPALAADPLVTALQQRYKELRGFDAAFTQTLKHQESGSTETRTGTLLFAKPLRLRWETKAPQAEVLVVNETEIWDYLPEEEVAYRYAPEVAQDSRSIIQVITGQSRLDTDFTVERLPDEGGLAVLSIFPKEPTTQMVEAQLWIDPSTRLIRKALVTDFYGNTNEVAFTRLTPDVTPGNDAFHFSPPKGIDVEDLRKEGAAERRLLQ